MPLISSKQSKDVQVRVRLKQDVLDEINQYVGWAELPNINVFFEEAALFVLQKDKDWKKEKAKKQAKE